jgi:hypothetical protein
LLAVDFLIQHKAGMQPGCCFSARDFGRRRRSVMKKQSVVGILVGAALLSAAPFSFQWTEKNLALSLNTADARVGRPLTATSVAGVHRRAYRRAYRRSYYYNYR